VASLAYLGAGLCFRWAWIEAGRTSATDDDQVARMARSEFGESDRVRRLIHGRTRSLHRPRRDARAPRGAARAYAEAVRRTSLFVERLGAELGMGPSGSGSSRPTRHPPSGRKAPWLERRRGDRSPRR